jgi:hypothetical protein
MNKLRGSKVKRMAVRATKTSQRKKSKPKRK